MLTLGTLARACIRWRQGPPVAIRPTLMRSLAPWAAKPGAASAAADAVVKKPRRDKVRRFIGVILSLTGTFASLMAAARNDKRIVAFRSPKGCEKRPFCTGCHA